MFSKKYTLAELEEAKRRSFNNGWREGHSVGLKLDYEFSKRFFSKITLNPDRLVYEIPHETYDVLKMQMQKESERE